MSSSSIEFEFEEQQPSKSQNLPIFDHFNSLSTSCTTILSLGQQWRNLEASFNSLHGGLVVNQGNCSEERERGVTADAAATTAGEVDLGGKFKLFEVELEEFEKRRPKVRDKRVLEERVNEEEDGVVVVSKRGRIDGNCGVVESRSGQVIGYSKRLLELKEEFEDKFEVLKSKANGLHVRVRGLGGEMKVVEMEEMRVGERRMEGLSGFGIRLCSKAKTRFSGEGLRGLDVEKSCEVVGIDEKNVDKVCRDLEGKAMRMEECLEEMEMDEERMREFSLVRDGGGEEKSEVELKGKGVDEMCRDLEGKVRRMEEAGEGVEMEEERMEMFSLVRDGGGEENSGVELKGEGVVEVCRDLEGKARPMEEGVEGMEMGEERMRRFNLVRDGEGEQKNEVELNGRGIDEGCYMMDSKEEEEVSGLCEGRGLREDQGDCEVKNVKERECHVVGGVGDIMEIRSHDLVESRRFNENEVCKISNELNCKGNEMSGEALELKTKQSDECIGELESKEKQISDQGMGLGRKRIIKQKVKRRVVRVVKRKKTIQVAKETELKEKDVSDEFCKLKDSEEKKMSEACKVIDERPNDRNGIEYHCHERVEKQRDIDGSCENSELLLAQPNVCVRRQGTDEGCKSESRENSDHKQTSDEALGLELEQINECMSELGSKKDSLISVAVVSEIDRVNECMSNLETEEENMIDNLSQVEEGEIIEESEKFPERPINEYCRTNELKGKETYEPNYGCEEMQWKQEPLRDCDMKLIVHKNANDCSIDRFDIKMDGKTLQGFLNERADKHESLREELSSMLRSSENSAKLVLDAVDGFFPLDLSKDVASPELGAIRSSCLLLLEELMKSKPLIRRAVKEEATKLAIKWRAEMRAEGESEVLAVGYLLLVATYNITSLFIWDHLSRLCQIADQHRLAPQLRQNLHLPKRPHVTRNMAQVSRKPCQSVMSDTHGADPSCLQVCDDGIHSLCRHMDADSLRLYLNEHVMDHSRLQDKILDALTSAPDPARLVLEISRTFHGTDSGEVHSDSNKTSCLFLLERLRKLSPVITPKVRHEATEFGIFWRARLDEDRSDWESIRTDSFGFLQFLLTYELVGLYGRKTLFGFFKASSAVELCPPEQVAELCRALRIQDFMPGLIKSLIEQQKQPAAVKCICVFNMERDFPPVPLLKTYLEIVRKKAEKLRKGSFPGKVHAADMEIRCLHNVLECISTYKLQNKLPPEPVTGRIRKLTDLKASMLSSRKRSASSRSSEPPGSQQRKRPQLQQSRLPFPSHPAHNFPNAPPVPVRLYPLGPSLPMLRR